MVENVVRTSVKETLNTLSNKLPHITLQSNLQQKSQTPHAKIQLHVYKFITISVPCFLAPVIDCIATGRIVFGGSSRLINSNDLKNLHEWVSNFVTDRYLELLKQTSVNVQIHVEVITREKLEKGVGLALA